MRPGEDEFRFKIRRSKHFNFEALRSIFYKKERLELSKHVFHFLPQD